MSLYIPENKPFFSADSATQRATSATVATVATDDTSSHNKCTHYVYLNELIIGEYDMNMNELISVAVTGGGGISVACLPFSTTNTFVHVNVYI